jgi:hypothetical protein
MSRKRALTDEQEAAASAWFNDYERVGTFEQKAKELGVDTETLRDAIKRARGITPRPLRRKLTNAELNQLLDDIPRGTEEVA